MTRSALLFCMASSILTAGCGSETPEKDRSDDEDSLVEIDFKDGANAHEPRFSPDGSTIAFMQSTQMSGSSELSVMDTAGDQRTTLAPAGTYLAGPAWTPDGKQIYFSADGGISVVAAGGGAASVAVMDFAAMDPDISPDGKSLVYAVNGGTLRLVDLATPDTVKDLGESGTSPRFSPDGQSIAFESGEKIKLMALASGEVTDVVDTGTYLASVDWFPDGERLAITSDDGIEIVTLGASPERKLVLDEFASMDLDLSADGKAIAYTVNGQPSIYVLRDF